MLLIDICFCLEELEECNGGTKKPEVQDGGGATTGQADKTVEAGRGLRMMTMVLMEQRKVTAPPKRRRRKAIRTCNVRPIGTIKEYFNTIVIPKEWNELMDKNGSKTDVDGGGGVLGAKRKGASLEEDTVQPRKIPRTENPEVEDDDQTGNGTKNDLGAKSGNGREPGNRRTKMGWNCFALTEKEEGDWTGDEPEIV